jgi:poly(hydroxyalkanoate) depolymerase family esterase
MQLVDWRELYASNQAIIERAGGTASPLPTALRGAPAPADTLPLLRSHTGQAPASSAPPRTAALAGPGLRFCVHAPGGVQAGAAVPLVCMLHGCTQDAAGFAVATRMNEAADRHGFVVVYPQQDRSQNPQGCWNWFLREHQTRGTGEPAALAATVRHVMGTTSPWTIDSRRVFVAGLSAGGAMAAVMLAAYPEAFAGGAIVAGVPYGCAGTDGEPVLAAEKEAFLANPFLGEAAWAAYACGITRAGPVPVRLTPFDREPGTWAGRVRQAGAPTPPAWPRVSLWQGDADPTVNPMNLRELLDQWTAVEGIDEVPDREEATAAYRRREFADAAGGVRVETYELPGMGHAVPVDPGTGPEQCGKVAPYFADRHVCAAFRIARFWGLTGGR